MKAIIPGTIVATSLNLLAGLRQDLPAVSLVSLGEDDAIDHQAPASDVPFQMEGLIPTPEEPEEYFSIQKVVPPEKEWDNATAKRFKELAAKEALATITPGELVELEELSLLRRRQTAQKPTYQELLDEMKAWRCTTRMIAALDEYVQEIGIDSGFKSRP